MTSRIGMDQAVQAAPETSPPVDLQHLARYTLGNRALDIEILGLFLAQAPATIARLAAADDHQQWREAAHTLKGSARGVGAWRLGDMAQAAERSAAWDDPGARSATIAQLRQALAAAEAFVGGLA